MADVRLTQYGVRITVSKSAVFKSAVFKSAEHSYSLNWLVLSGV